MWSESITVNSLYRLARSCINTRPMGSCSHQINSSGYALGFVCDQTERYRRYLFCNHPSDEWYNKLFILNGQTSGRPPPPPTTVRETIHDRSQGRFDYRAKRYVRKWRSYQSFLLSTFKMKSFLVIMIFDSHMSIFPKIPGKYPE